MTFEKWQLSQFSMVQNSTGSYHSPTFAASFLFCYFLRKVSWLREFRDRHFHSYPQGAARQKRDRRCQILVEHSVI